MREYGKTGCNHGGSFRAVFGFFAQAQQLNQRIGYFYRMELDTLLALFASELALLFLVFWFLRHSNRRLMEEISVLDEKLKLLEQFVSKITKTPAAPKTETTIERVPQEAQDPGKQIENLVFSTAGKTRAPETVYAKTAQIPKK